MPTTGNSSALPGRMAPVWVSGTTYPAGYVVWSPTDYQYYMRKSAGAGTTDPVTDTTNWQPTGDRAVKSIQRGVVSYTGNTGAAITISAVNTAKSQMTWSASALDPVTSLPVPVSFFLTNSTTLSIANTGGSATMFVRGSWEIVERY